jgi:hypothetical protein
MTSQQRTEGWNRKSSPNFNSQSSWAEGLFESFTSVFWRSKIILLEMCVHPDPSFIANLFVIVLGLHIQRTVIYLWCNYDDCRQCRTICYYTTKLTVNAEKGELLSLGIVIPSDLYVPGLEAVLHCTILLSSPPGAPDFPFTCCTTPLIMLCA